ncbi:uncharacterized protein AMSG_10538 [Thecamonas trahens ATCC 50062]|uniref:Uncharacterized protein n=1 Tax=Thecamonas trahens ATCC 50062 TaxID=461836 RepID=A0A0L0DRH1_THETB|nr:hypothetical protein AMSG_10538 [Thecamonas trahens ATCC 50062]KNC54885.1 hypothetical protein AMSG_10538 [Thecamonas trahens ATCC 50062]|eukprot:XP_013753477.1 hypothetical protein AMSG_10538 [Thecamonas trahens ATCC 50062]
MKDVFKRWRDERRAELAALPAPVPGVDDATTWARIRLRTAVGNVKAAGSALLKAVRATAAEPTRPELWHGEDAAASKMAIALQTLCDDAEARAELARIAQLCTDVLHAGPAVYAPQPAVSDGGGEGASSSTPVWTPCPPLPTDGEVWEAAVEAAGVAVTSTERAYARRLMADLPPCPGTMSGMQAQVALLRMRLASMHELLLHSYQARSYTAAARQGADQPVQPGARISPAPQSDGVPPRQSREFGTDLARAHHVLQVSHAHAVEEIHALKVRNLDLESANYMLRGEVQRLAALCGEPAADGWMAGGDGGGASGRWNVDHGRLLTTLDVMAAAVEEL